MSWIRKAVLVFAYWFATNEERGWFVQQMWNRTVRVPHPWEKR